MKNLCVEISRVRQLPKLRRQIKKQTKEFDRFFGYKLSEPLVVLLTSRRQIDALWGRKTEDWSVGWTRERVIYILSPEKYVSESNHRRRSEFWTTLRHEHAHLYIRSVAGWNVPKWLNEGLACWLAGQRKRTPPLALALSVIRPMGNFSVMAYPVGYFWTSLLIRKFGEKKILILLRKCGRTNSPANFPRIFRAVYGIRWTKGELEALYQAAGRVDNR